VLVVTVTQQGEAYTLDGHDDLCGASRRAPVVGVATPNPDGSIALGFQIVTASGSLLGVAARISLATISGEWRDAAERTGAFAFGASTGGAPRPPTIASAIIPPAFALQTDGGFVARGDILAGTIPESGAGVRMMWHPAKAAFRAGRVRANGWDDAQVGAYSVAFGDNTLASGDYSLAAGFYSTAAGRASTALGSSFAGGDYSAAFNGGTNALGHYSAAFGNNTAAFGNSSLASGIGSVASGDASFAGGEGSTARGRSSLAFGRAEVLANANGSFVWGDQSTTTNVQSDQPNQFIVRAAGGFRLATNPLQTTGVIMVANASAWSSLSDVNSKEHFRDLAGEDLLAKIAGMPVREWNYKAQGPSIRHLGPTAQDFHAAFGLGEDSLRISTIDADGVSLAAMKALEVRTRDLAGIASTFDERVAALAGETGELRARPARLEALLAKR